MRWLVLTALVTFNVTAEEAAAPPDGVNRSMQDGLLDQLEGHWQLTGRAAGHEAKMLVDATWELNHQFLELHWIDQRSVAAPAKPYEARVFIGYDNTSDRYVCHWIDVFGGRFSETLGFGTRGGDTIELVFEYPDGPFHTKLQYERAVGTWRIVMTQKDAGGKWKTFADQTLRRVRAPEKPTR